MRLVKTGLQQLVEERRNLLKGRRIGLVTQPAAVTIDLRAAEDALIAAGATLTALFGPEHGFDGAAADGAAVAHAIHARLGVPVYSLYGADREPTAAMLAEVDLLVFDMQDVGVRFYTYLSTLYYLLRACGRTGIPLLVLDRPNPINGVAVEGPPVTPELESFVGIVDIPIRHGMTLGELARLINAEQRFDADLTVLAMTGWRRDWWFDQSGLPWIPTSPGMPQLITATVYPGMCFVEGTNLSEGRGTTLPFETVGAPWLDGYRLAVSLNALDSAWRALSTSTLHAVGQQTRRRALPGGAGPRARPQRHARGDDRPARDRRVSHPRRRIVSPFWSRAGKVARHTSTCWPATRRCARGWRWGTT
jgi:uncharacterized protein YbbC (DUF1343 family)